MMNSCTCNHAYKNHLSSRQKSDALYTVARNMQQAIMRRKVYGQVDPKITLLRHIALGNNTIESNPATNTCPKTEYSLTRFVLN